jgi:(1->4)-alpha-D-glucan 1-alpha-D-glucosylmutase
MPREWESLIKLFRRLNRGRKKYASGRAMPDDNDEYFIYQTLLGAWPAGEFSMLEFLARMNEYIIKAVREAKVHTAWIKPDSEYEEACTAFMCALLDESGENAFLKVFMPFQKRAAFFGMLNSLSQVIIKATCPGVPDYYQGSELWDFNLVDPDNRRPVDFQARARMLADIAAWRDEDIPGKVPELSAGASDGKIKLFLTHRLLRARKERELLFRDGAYLPLQAEGIHAGNILAFMRQAHGQWAMTIAGRFFTGVAREGEFPVSPDIWGDTRIIMPAGAPHEWYNVVTGGHCRIEGTAPVSSIFSVFPGASLVSAA